MSAILRLPVDSYGSYENYVRAHSGRFWSHVEKSDGCWNWTGILEDGYGRIGWCGRNQRAHRVSWEIANGRPSPDGMHICHSCDNRRCVNPAHLRADTHAENMRDRIRHGTHYQANQTHCKHGHEFTPENTKVTSEGTRACVECRARWSAEAARKRKAQRAAEASA